MTRYEALMVRAAGWADMGPEAAEVPPTEEHAAYYAWAHPHDPGGMNAAWQNVEFTSLALFAALIALIERHAPHECNPVIFGDGEYARCSICGDDSFPVTLDAGYGLPPGSFAILSSQYHQAEVLGALRHVHDGTDRGELRALLCEAWGPSPAIATKPVPLSIERLTAHLDALTKELESFDGGDRAPSPPARLLREICFTEETLRAAKLNASDLAGLAARESQGQDPRDGVLATIAEEQRRSRIEVQDREAAVHRASCGGCPGCE